MAWYSIDQVKSDRVLNKLAIYVLCYVKIWIIVDKPRTAEVD